MSEPAQIRKLDETVVNRIAAGEVIQRPASALKELIENSLDAKSTNIQITVKQGGLKHMQIQDNGTGIRKEEFEIVCERFTTSKLRLFEDLSTIATYGFRGEALASISHVAHLTIQSKTANAKCAYRASFVDGKLKETPKAIAGNQGTQIIVEDLFYNMNIRQRALCNASEEYQKIADVVGKYAIHNSKVGFALKKFGANNHIRTPPNSNAVDNIRTIYGNTIAKELIEFSFSNEAFKYKANGWMTNVNYSTKKFVFLLFINHRLVESRSLKKCIDQVYTTYLPKNMHPFIYLSLELDSKTVDVNIHPTKHEVYFLHEEQIIQSICTALETKLLGSNNSRVFYIQTKLPGVSSETIPKPDSSKNQNKPVNPKDFVRTDYAEQKLEKFFGATVKKSELSPKQDDNSMRIDEEGEFQKFNEEFVQSNEDFVDRVLNTTTKSTPPSPPKNVNNKKISPKNKSIVNTSIFKIPKIECELTSVLELRKDVEEHCNGALREIFAQHVFVGSVDIKQALLQHNTRLYLCNTEKIMEELFYQFVLYNFQNFGVVKFYEPLPINELAIIALNLPEAGWSPEDGEKADLALKITDLLTEKGPMLSQYFSMEIDEYGNLKSIPLLIDNHTPEMVGLPMYILRLATEVDWESEKRCFEMFARETALYYSQLREENTVESGNWKWTVEHVFYPAIKEYFVPSKKFAENAAILQIENLPNLYKVFERC